MYKYFAVMTVRLRNIGVLIILSALCLLSACTSADRYVTLSGYAQGGTYAVKINMKDVSVPVRQVQDSVDALLNRIDRSLSGYNKNSILSRFNAGETVMPDSLFLDIYETAYEIFEVTGGVVDVASAPLFDLWGFGFTTDSLPSDEEVNKVLAASGMARLKRQMPSPLNGAMLIDSGNADLPKLNYNAIAQGYSCDVVARYLYSIGVKDMLVDIGEIFCDGLNPSGRPWTVGIDRPLDGNNTPGEQIQGIFRAPAGPHGIVTSGNYRKYYVRDGKKYAHTIDPRTGYPVSHNLLSATIVAENATLADAYATYCMVVGLEQSIVFLQSREDLEGCLIYDKDGTFETWCSEGFVLENL